LVYLQDLSILKNEFFPLLFSEERVSMEIELSGEPDNIRGIFNDLSALTEEVLQQVTVGA
jgi:hypothetical protein